MSKVYRSIGFGGGGTRGGLHVGVLKAIEEIQGHLEFPDGIYGASAGAIVATAVAFGMKPDAIRHMYDKHFSLTQFIPTPRVETLFGFMDNRGMFSMDLLVSQLLTAFGEQGIDLRGMRICDVPRKLYIITANMTRGRTDLLTGRVPLLQALCCSAAIPFVFRPQILYGDVYLDAGVQLRCIRKVVPPETLVIHISGGWHKLTPESTIGDIAYAFYSGKSTLYSGDNMIKIRGVHFSILGNLTTEERDYLIREGYSQTMAFFSERAGKKLLHS